MTINMAAADGSSSTNHADGDAHTANSSTSDATAIDDGTASNVLGQFRCPLTRKVMKDPVVAPDGYTYERSAIEAWLEKHDVSPITNEDLTGRRKELVPNMTMRVAIQLLVAR